MLAVTVPTTTRTVTLCNQDGPIGTVDFINGAIVVQAAMRERQGELERLVHTRFHMHARLAKEAGSVLDKQTFFDDMPHFVRGTYCYATRPLRTFVHLVPPELRLPPFDPFKPHQRRAK
jgi:hypothetical protein